MTKNFYFITLALLLSKNTPAHGQAPIVAAEQEVLSSLRASINSDTLPKHVAIIMDGNGRWAMQRGKERLFGHKSAMHSVREAVEGCAELNIPYLTLYAFSIENWDRPPDEVAGMMDLIATTIDGELTELAENKVKLSFVGDLQRLPTKCQRAIQKALEATEKNQGLHLTIALSYSGRWDLTEASKALIQAVQERRLGIHEITPKVFQQFLPTRTTPDIDLLVRTSGEQRTSGFMPWQAIYAELLFSAVFWPDFRKKHFYEAILAYQKRYRRFGKVAP
ncbi:MAG: polyprenyl diphosphate synthase [Bacteroidota bacterium]